MIGSLKMNERLHDMTKWHVIKCWCIAKENKYTTNI